MESNLNALLALATHVAEAKGKPLALHINKHTAVRVSVCDSDDEAEACVAAWKMAELGIAPDPPTLQDLFYTVRQDQPHTLWFIAADNLVQIGGHETFEAAQDAANSVSVSLWGIGPSQNADSKTTTYCMAYSPSSATIQAMRSSAGSNQ